MENRSLVFRWFIFYLLPNFSPSYPQKKKKTRVLSITMSTPPPPCAFYHAYMMQICSSLLIMGLFFFFFLISFIQYYFLAASLGKAILLSRPPWPRQPNGKPLRSDSDARCQGPQKGVPKFPTLIFTGRNGTSYILKTFISLKLTFEPSC